MLYSKSWCLFQFSPFVNSLIQRKCILGGSAGFLTDSSTEQECGLLEPHHLIRDLCIPLFVAYHVSVSSWLTGWVCWCSALEGAEATLLSASGMCVTTTMLLALVPGGGHIVTTTDCYRRTRQFIQTVLPKMGITVLPSTSLGFWVGIKLFILWVKNMIKFFGTGMVYAWVKLEEQLMIFCVQ